MFALSKLLRLLSNSIIYWDYDYFFFLLLMGKKKTLSVEFLNILEIYLYFFLGHTNRQIDIHKLPRNNKKYLFVFPITNLQ